MLSAIISGLGTLHGCHNIETIVKKFAYMCQVLY